MKLLPPALSEKVHRRWRALTLMVIAASSSLLGISGSIAWFDDMLSELDGRVRQRQASGELHIVEIDARSIAAIDRWPWPRRNYAAAVNQLKAAGAASIAFDVDFSSHSNAADDGIFAEALSREGAEVVLPTFGQRSGGGRKGWTDSLPIALLRPHASLAAVSVLPDPDGYVRRIPIGTITDDTARPSLSAMLAGVNAAAGSDFPIDLSIERTSIPRHSFIDIRDGKFDRHAIAGKHVLIGATAVELGDRYAVPSHGVIPGVVIQALAAETLRHGIPIESGWQLPMLLALALSALVLRLRRRATLAAAALGLPVLLTAAGIFIHGAFNWRFEIAPALFALMYANAAAGAARWIASARRQRSHDRETGMPNRFALINLPHAGEAIVAARILDFDKLSAGVGEAATTDLICRLRDRIALVAGNEIYRAEDRVLAWRCGETGQLEEQMAALRAVMLNPLEVAGRRVTVNFTVGAAAGKPGDPAERTLACAMLAAETASTNGESWHFHGAEEDDAVDLELALLGELDDAIANGDIHVVYQPKLGLQTNRIVSVEALVRWNHPTRGHLRPDLFIPLAERNDRIASLTLHVLKQTITDLQAWSAAGHPITGAVNISAKLLNSGAFIGNLRWLIEKSDLAPKRLTFEVTESAAMTDTAKAAAALQSFKDLGIKISIDDYGTGQSTLSYLKRLPLDELKIDRSFVQFAHMNRGDGVLVRSTIDLAHELGLRVVAEGVEDEACLTFLRASGCDVVQGYLISKPVGASAIEELLGRYIRTAEAA